jgi:Do/DeqQ family serine protease
VTPVQASNVRLDRTLQRPDEELNMTSLRKLLAAGVVVGALGTGAALRSGPPVAQAAPSAMTDASIPDVAERVVDSVVNISTTSIERGPAAYDPFFTDPDSPMYGMEPTGRKAMSKGSGVIVTSSGRILTNAHVVRDATNITVTLHDGSDLTAKVIGVDPKADIAVIQLQGKVPALKPIAFGDSSALRLGEVVLAVGDPFGVGKSVTMGIVSAKGRSGMNIEDYEDFIQTDAAINPGNSGGALVNLRGELVGINTAIASPNRGYAGIGFAIPTNMARPIMDMLVKDGKVARGYLGVNIATVTSALAKDQGLPAARGAVIAAVQPGSPAAKAGLSDGDVITAIDGLEIRSSDVLKNKIAMRKPGSSIELRIARSNGTSTVKVQLARLPDDEVVTPRRRVR